MHQEEQVIMIAPLINFKRTFSSIGRILECTKLATHLLLGLLALTNLQPHAHAVQAQHLNFSPLKEPRLDLVGGQWDTEQDKFGFLWFGGAGGLARYDGYNVIIYRHDPNDPHSISGNYVSDILVDSNKTMWVATRRGLNRYNPETDQFESYFADGESGLSHNFIWALHETKSGQILVGTGGGLDVYQPALNRFSTLLKNNDILAGKSVSTILDDNTGNFWIGTENNGVYRFDAKLKLEKHYYSEGQPENKVSHNNIRKIFQDNSGTLWVATYNGLNRHIRDEDTFHPYLHDPHNPTSLGGNVVRSIIQDSGGRIWFGIDGAGLNYYLPELDAFKRIQADKQLTNSLINDKVRSIFEDNDGGIWVGHFPAGVSYLDKYASTFTNYRHNPLNPNSLSNSDILSVFEDSEKNLWIGTERGLNHLNRKTNQITRYEHAAKDPNSLQADPVLTVYEDSKGTIWVGTWGGGLSTLNKSTGVFTKINVAKAKEARITYETKDGTIWVGTEYGLNKFDSKTGEFKLYTHDVNQPKSILPLGVNSIFVDSRGIFWLACDTGVATFNIDTEAFTRYTHDPKNPKGLGPGYFTQITEDSKGKIWIVSGADGVNRYDPTLEKFQLFRSKDGLSDDIIGGVVEDNNGYIWISTGRGISRWNPSKNIFDKIYTTEHGLPGNLFKRPTAIKNYKGAIIFGSTHGLTLFNPNELYENVVAPKIVLTDFQIFYKPIDINDPNSPISKKVNHLKHITLNHKQSVFSFEFSALNFTMPDKNLYTYKLEGFDEEWVFAGHRRTASYTNLDAGKYTLRVIGSNNEGVWNEEGKNLTITVLPPWWKTWWAYLIYCSLAFAALVQVIWRQIRKRQLVEEQNRILEVRVSERTAELEQKTNDIQAMLTNIHQGLLTIETNGKIHPEYSSFLQVIFESDELAGQDALEFLFNGANISRDVIDQHRAVVYTVIGEDVFNFDVNAHLFMSEYEKTINKHIKKLTLDWNPIIEDGLVTRLMVTVRDVTELRKVEEQAIAQQRELDIVAQLITIPPQKFIAFEQSTNTMLGENRFIFGGKPQCDQALIKTLFRSLHTIKGNSRTYKFSYLSDMAHLAESYYSTLLSDDTGVCDILPVMDWHTKVEEVFNEYQHIFYDVIHHRNDTAANDIFLNERYLGKIQACLHSLSNDFPIVESAKPLQEAKTIMDQILSSPLETVLEDLIVSLGDISLKLGKLKPDVKIDSVGYRIKSNVCSDITGIFTHILRNSLDHGIEPPAVRQQAGKTEKGHIHITCEEDNEQLLIKVGDDGQGLNLKVLLEKGETENVWKDSASRTAIEVADIIFASGLSTKTETTEISGRGVGMDAVRQSIRDLGGDIKIRFKDSDQKISQNAAFEFWIYLPAQYYCNATAKKT